MTQKVALIRERHLTNSEVIGFDLGPDYDVVAFGTKGRSQKVDIPTRSLYSSGSITGPVLGDAARAIQSAITGSSTHMYGLVDALSEFDIVHTIETFQGFSEQAIKAKRRHGCAVVCTVFENIPYFAESDHYSRTWREAAKHRDATSIKQTVRTGADIFIAKSDRAKTALEIEGVEPDRIEVIPLGVDPDLFTPGAANSADDLPGRVGRPDILNVVYIGRYTWEKGLYDLLSAWQAVQSRLDREVVLTLVGSGPDDEHLRRLIDRVDVPNVEVCGPVDYEQVPAVYDAADLTVVPSLPTRFWQEQFGRVVIESQACGTPVIASETGGIPYTMGGHGVLAQPGDPHDWSEQIVSLLRNPDRRERLSVNGRQHVLDERSIHDVRARIRDVYDRIT